MSAPFDLVVRGSRVVLPDGERPAAVAVRDGRVAAVEPRDAALDARETLDADGLVVLPGLVDSHVHVNDPGRAEWEGWDTATRAAAAGGVTTVVDMPLNSVPATTTVEAFRAKLDAAGGRARVDYGLWGGVVPGNWRDVEPLVASGACGCKAFLVDSGVSEFPPAGDEELGGALVVLAATGAPLLVHAEEASALSPGALARDPRRHAAWLASRPARSEAAAIERVAGLAREARAMLHIVHVSSADGVEAVRAARGEDARITAETCPHYLAWTADAVPDAGAAPPGTWWKCAPPIREAGHREALWEALRSGDLDLVASDHSPSPPSMKAGDFASAWGGIASLELSLAVTWTEARARGFGPADIARWMSAAPARLAGLDDRKGSIAPGMDADLVVWAPDAERVVRADRLHQRHPVTPYAGRTLAGRVVTTILRGSVVYDADHHVGEPGGRFLPRRSVARHGFANG